MNIHVLNYKGIKYLRAEDVAEYIRDLAATEETDTRNRLEIVAREMEKETHIGASQ